MQTLALLLQLASLAVMVLCKAGATRTLSTVDGWKLVCVCIVVNVATQLWHFMADRQLRRSFLVEEGLQQEQQQQQRQERQPALA